MAERACDRLKKAREAAGYPTAAAFFKTIEDQGLTESNYRHKENGTREISVADAKLFARALLKKLPWITWTYIVNGDRPKIVNMAQMLGYAGAGEEIFPFDDDNAWDPVPAPPGLEQPMAVDVKGGSMLPVFRDGDRLYFGAQEAAIANLVGKDCLVQVVEGPRLIKKLMRGSKRGLYRLHSYATGRDTGDLRLEWAAPIRWIERR